MKGSGIYDGTCVKMYSEYYITLPGGYRLPVKLIKETVCSYDMQKQLRSAANTEQALSVFSKVYLRDQMVALTVLDAKEYFSSASGRSSRRKILSLAAMPFMAM